MVPKAENTVQPWWIPVAHCVAEVPLGVSELRGQPVVLLCFSTRGFNKQATALSFTRKKSKKEENT